MKKFWHRITGKRSFRVVYESLRDPGYPVTLKRSRSRTMDYKTARDYAQIFNGEVIFDPQP